MAKDTLLDIVQGILSDADGDNVNSIEDTIESEQCAALVRETFYDIVDNYDIKYHDRLIKLDATGVSTPCAMTRPEGFHSITDIWYDKRLLVGDDPAFDLVRFKDPVEFLEMQQSLRASDTNVDTQDLTNSGFVINCRNDKAPSFWTILEGYDEILFDSYDSSLETNLQQSKSLAKGTLRPTLNLTDGAIPDLPKHLIQLLKNRARAMYFDIYKDGVTREVDKRQRNSEVRSQRKKYITKKLQQQRTGPNYGRK